MVSKSLSLVAAAALALCSLAAQAQNRLANGGFEDAQTTLPGNPDPIPAPDDTKAQGWLAFQSGYTRSTDAYSGSWSALISQVNQFQAGVMLQDTKYSSSMPDLVAGQALTLSFQAKASVAEDVGFYNMSYNLKYLNSNSGVVAETGFQNFAGQTNNDTWSKISSSALLVPVGAVAALVEFSVAGGPRIAAVNIDNVSLVPEPGTYALMLAGLVGVGAIARRRRSV